MRIIFVGDPGVGKSTLLNALVGQTVFQSGLSFGSGLTQHRLSHKDENGNVWTDTPGLADVKIQEHAAAEIEKALKESAQQEMKLGFVTTWSNGRVLSHKTIEMVLNAFPPHKQISIGIIVNKITTKNAVHLQSNPQAYQKVVNGLYKNMDGRCQGRHVLFYERIGELEDASNKLHVPTTAIKAFLDELPPNIISPTEVELVADVETKKRREELQKLACEKEQELEKLRKEQEQRAAEQARILREHEARKEHERLRMKREQEVEQQRILDEVHSRHQIALANASSGGDCVIL